MELEVFSGRRVDESERAGVEQLAMHFYTFDLCRLPARSVQLIAGKRVVDVCHVDSDLMGTSGLEYCPHKGISSESLEHLYMSDCIPCRASVHRVSHAVALIAPDRFIYGQLILAYIVVDQSGVLTGDAVLLELGCERLMCLVVLGYHEKTAGILVYPVDYAGAYHTVYGRKRITHVEHDRIDECAGGIAWTRCIPYGFVIYHLQFLWSLWLREVV